MIPSWSFTGWGLALNTAFGLAALVLAWRIERQVKASRETMAEGGIVPEALEAASYGVPYLLNHFWPPAHHIYNERLPIQVRVWTKDRFVCPEMYRAKIGDLVPVFEDTDGNTYWYEVFGFAWAPGDDHIVSPKEFDLRFRERRTPK